MNIFKTIITLLAISTTAHGAANNTVMGNISGSNAIPYPLTSTQATTVLNTFTSGLKGLTPASGGGTTNFLRADGTFAVPTDTGISQLTGDVTAGPGSGSQAATIANNAVTNAKAAQMPAHTFKGNDTASLANQKDLTQAELTAELNTFTSGLKGIVPASGGGTTNFLRADGTFAAAGASSPLTTKGDLYGYDTGNARIPVGTNGQVLTADSTVALGVKWAAGGVNPLSEVFVDSGNGVGSTNTAVKRFLNVRKNIGTDITYATSATLGDSFTANTTGIYAIMANTAQSSGTIYSIITVNGTALASGSSAQTYAAGSRCWQARDTVGTTSFGAHCQWAGNLTAGDVVRILGNGEACANDMRCQVSMIKVAN